MHYKLRNRFYIKEAVILIFSTIMAVRSVGQDLYTPPPVTGKWEKYLGLLKADTFGIGHNRRIAVDLTIIDAFTGTELDMGTGYG